MTLAGQTIRRSQWRAAVFHEHNISNSADSVPSYYEDGDNRETGSGVPWRGIAKGTRAK